MLDLPELVRHRITMRRASPSQVSRGSVLSARLRSFRHGLLPRPDTRRSAERLLKSSVASHICHANSVTFRADRPPDKCTDASFSDIVIKVAGSQGIAHHYHHLTPNMESPANATLLNVGTKCKADHCGLYDFLPYKVCSI